MKSTSQHKQLKQLNNQNLIDSLRFSIRITRKSVSSVSLKKNIVSIWLLLVVSNPSLYKKSKKLIMDFIYDSLNYWKKDTAKGFSDFVTERMIQDILEKEDFLEYKKIKDILGTL